MTDGDERGKSQLNQEDEEIAAEIVDDLEALLDSLPHLYREEVSQPSGAQDRLDQTTNWAFTVLVGLLTLVFSSPDMPAYLLLIAVVALCIFLSLEVFRKTSMQMPWIRWVSNIPDGVRR